MNEVARRRELWFALLAVPATAALSLIVVMKATSAADVVGARQAGKHGDVRLTGATPGRAGVAVPAMLPGQTATRCVEVTAPAITADRAELRVYGESAGDLGRHLRLTVRRGDVGATCALPGVLTSVFAGPLDDLGHDFATGRGGHRPPNSGAAVPYLLEISLAERTPNSAQGMRAELDVLWEVRGGDVPR